MHARWKLGISIAVGLALLTAGLEGAAMAQATTAGLDAVEAVAAADAAAGASAAGAVTRSEGVTADLPGADVAVPLDADAGLTLAPDQGPQLSMELPGASRADGQAIGGNVVFDDAVPGASVVARPTGDGVQALVVIDGASAPRSFRFPIEVGGRKAALRKLPGGAIEVRSAHSNEVVAFIDPAWARDANGAAVPTRFAIDGSTVVQIVDHRSAAYPVVADPKTCGIATCTYYFGKQATKDIATAGAAAGLCGGILKVLPVAGVGCSAAAGAVIVQANRARNRGMCLKVKFAKGPFPVWYPDIYRGKYCK